MWQIFTLQESWLFCPLGFTPLKMWPWLWSMFKKGLQLCFLMHILYWAHRPSSNPIVPLECNYYSISEINSPYLCLGLSRIYMDTLKRCATSRKKAFFFTPSCLCDDIQQFHPYYTALFLFRLTVMLKQHWLSPYNRLDKFRPIFQCNLIWEARMLLRLSLIINVRRKSPKSRFTHWSDCNPPLYSLKWKEYIYFLYVTDIPYSFSNLKPRHTKSFIKRQYFSLSTWHCDHQAFCSRTYSCIATNVVFHQTYFGWTFEWNKSATTGYNTCITNFVTGSYTLMTAHTYMILP